MEWGIENVLNNYMFFIILAISVGVIVYILLLPYWIVALYNKTFNQRFKASLRIPDEINTKTIDNKIGEVSNE
jgi:hypothetical protein